MANFSVTKKKTEGHITYQLKDQKLKMDFSLVPDIGNWGYSLRVHGNEVFYPRPSFEQYIKERGLGYGNPIMAPFANRIDRDHYYFEGKKYLLNGDLENFLRTPPTNYPIHGLLAYDNRWEVVKTTASDAAGASVTSRLEFYKYPDLTAQFPFAHVHEVTYRLKGGKSSARQRSRTSAKRTCRFILDTIRTSFPTARANCGRFTWLRSMAGSWTKD